MKQIDHCTKKLNELLKESTIDVIHCLNNTNPKAKEEFLQDSKLLKPQNQYENLDIDQVERNFRLLDEAEALLEANEFPETYSCVYNAILQYTRRENQFVLANYLYNHSRTTKERNLAAEQHSSASIGLYGPVNPDIFWSIINEKLGSISPSSLSVEGQQVYEELMDAIGPIRTASSSYFMPQKATFLTFSSWMNNFFSDFFRHIPEGQQIFSVQEVCEITNEIIRTEPKVIDKNWEAIVEPYRPTAETDTHQKKIHYPGKRSRGLYTLKDVKAIIVHELGVHALRSMPFAGHPISALAYGLPGYVAFEEGLATAVADCVNGKFRHPGQLHYVSIGLATLLKKNFREVFEIQTRLEWLSGGVSASQCFDSVQRAFRGTGELPNNKDLIYFTGNNLVWEFIENHISDQKTLLHLLFETGKSNPLDPTYGVLFSEVCKKSVFF